MYRLLRTKKLRSISQLGQYLELRHDTFVSCYGLLTILTVTAPDVVIVVVVVEACWPRLTLLAVLVELPLLLLLLLLLTCCALFCVRSTTRH